MTLDYLQLEKYKSFDFGRCPRVCCSGQSCLPVGQSDIPRAGTVKVYCPRCEDIYYPRSKYQGSILWNVLLELLSTFYHISWEFSFFYSLAPLHILLALKTHILLVSLARLYSIWCHIKLWLLGIPLFSYIYLLRLFFLSFLIAISLTNRKRNSMLILNIFIREDARNSSPSLERFFLPGLAASIFTQG